MVNMEEILAEHKKWLDGTGGTHANLRYANLSGANLCDVDLRDADLRGANLCDADLRGANLCGANLRGANVSGIKTDYMTYFFALQCPEEGSFVAWKNCSGTIVKLLIPEHAKRSSATTRKCRASEAVVLKVFGAEPAISGRGAEYRTGETVIADSWDDDRWNECSHGIHFFLTRHEAKSW